MADTVDTLLQRISAAVGDRTKTIPRRAPQRRPSASFGKVFDPRTYGAKCDGTTNDWAALKSCAEACAASPIGTASSPIENLLIIPGDMRITVAPNDFLWIGPRTTVRGVVTNGKPGRIIATGGGQFPSVLKLAGDSITVEDLIIERGGDAWLRGIAIGDGKNSRLDRVQLRGRGDLYTSEFHGILLEPGTAGIRNLSMVECVDDFCDFGLYQDSKSTGAVDGVTVDGHVGMRARGTNLEFNAPQSLMRRISVRNSRFFDNRSQGTTAAWAVGFAHVTDSSIESCEFDGFPLVPIHIEDRSSNIDIRGCRITNSATRASGFASHVFLVSGTKNVRIWPDNVFDMAANYVEDTWAVYAGKGGSSMPCSAITVDPGVAIHYGGARTKRDYSEDNAITFASIGAAATSGQPAAPTTGAALASQTFDSSVEGWNDWGNATVTRDTTTKKTGTGSLKLAFAAATPAQAASAALPAPAGVTVTLSYAALAPTGQQFKLNATFKTEAGADISTSQVDYITGKGAWDARTATLTPPANSHRMILVFSAADASWGVTATLNVDDLTVTS